MRETGNRGFRFFKTRPRLVIHGRKVRGHKITKLMTRKIKYNCGYKIYDTLRKKETPNDITTVKTTQIYRILNDK